MVTIKIIIKKLQLELRFFRVLSEWQVIYASEITFHLLLVNLSQSTATDKVADWVSSRRVHKKQDLSSTKAFTVNPLDLLTSRAFEPVARQ